MVQVSSGRLLISSKNFKPHSLIALFIVSWIIRLWGVRYFPFPHFRFFADELLFCRKALEIGVDSWNPHYFFKPSFLIYFLHPFFKFLAFLNPDLVTQEYMATEFFILGRVLMALLGALTVLAVYFLGKYLFDEKTAWLGALFLAVSFIHVRQSHYVMVDTPMTFFCTVALIYAVRIYLKGGIKDYLLAGVFTGLATGTKYNAIILVVSLVTAHVLRGLSLGGRWRDLFFNRKIVLTLLLTLLFFGFTTPYLLNWSTAHKTFLSIKSTIRGKGILYFHLGFYLFEALGVGMGSIALLLCFYSVSKQIWKGDLKSWIVLSFALISFWVFVTSRMEYVRYVLPLIPLVCIFSAQAVFEISSLFRRNMVRWMVLVILCGGILLPNAIKAFAFGRILLKEDSRSIASRWMGQHIPVGSHVLMDLSVSPPVGGSPDQLPAFNELLNKYRKHYYSPYLAKYRMFLTEKYPSNFYVHFYFHTSPGRVWLLNGDRVKEISFERLWQERIVTHIVIVDYLTKNKMLMTPENDFVQFLNTRCFPICEISPYKEGREPDQLAWEDIVGPWEQLWNRVRPGPKVTIYRVVPNIKTSNFP